MKINLPNSYPPLLLLLVLWCLPILVFSQQGKATSIVQALDELTAVYQVNFIYDNQQLEVAPPADYQTSQNNLEGDLKKLLNTHNLYYKKLNDNTYVIKARQGKINPKINTPKPKKTSNLAPKIIEKIKVSGVVYDRDDRETLIGVNITSENGVGTITDLDGRFELTVDKGAILSFSYIGYVTKKMPASASSAIEILLEKNAALLDEVVVVGYGSQKRSDLTGALSRVSEVELKQLPNTGLEQAIQGRSAGVYVTQNSGAPGGGLSIRIRGTGSTISAEPLYVIDGIPVINDNQRTSATFEADGGGQYPNALTTINPNDIESIEILKDASATAIYGARAANGVVLITTKRGKKGSSNLNYDSYVGVQQLYRRIPMMSLQQYAEYLADINLGNIEEFSRPELLGQGTDWQDEIFRNALMYNHQLSLTAGTDKTRFSMGGGLHRKEGIVRGSSFDRYSFKLNVDHGFSNNINIGGNILAARTSENITFNDNSSGVIYTALLTPPMVPARNLDGSFGAPSGDVVLTFNNPLANALETEDVNKKNRILASIYGEAQIFPWLKYRTELATDILNSNHNTFWPSFERGRVQRKSRVRRNNSNNFFWINKHLVTVQPKLRENHSLNVLLGFEAQEGRYEWLYAARDNLPTNDLRELTLGDAGTQVNDGGAGHWALLSGFSRLNYSYKDRYLLTSTFRADGSSRFNPSNRFGFFPSAAFAWRVSNEEFLKSAESLTNLKVRLGYGSVGNQEIGLYSFLTNLRSQDVAFGNVLATGIVPDNISNPGVKWESSEQINLGIDLGLFNNRVEVIIDIYNKDSKDMLLPAILPATAGGLNPPFINIGEMNNKGIEFTLNTQNFAGKFNWKTAANLSINRNTVIDLGSTGSLTGIVQRVALTRTVEGQPIAQFFGHQVIGIFQSLEEIEASPFQETGTRPGDLIFKDLNNDNVINDLDRTYIGNPNPDFTVNLVNDLSYKNFDINIFLRGVFGNEVYNLLRRDVAGTGAWHNQSVDVVDRWTIDNPTGSEPRPDGNDSNQNRRVSDRFIEDGSFIRLQNITLGYNMPQNVCQKLRMRSFRIYASGQNLFTITDYSGYDPEIGSFNQNPLINGLDNGRFPVGRSFTFGLNVNF